MTELFMNVRSSATSLHDLRVFFIVLWSYSYITKYMKAMYLLCNTQFLLKSFHHELCVLCCGFRHVSANDESRGVDFWLLRRLHVFHITSWSWTTHDKFTLKLQDHWTSPTDANNPSYLIRHALFCLLRLFTPISLDSSPLGCSFVESVAIRNRYHLFRIESSNQGVCLLA